MVERYRDGRQSDPVHGPGNDAEDQTTRCRLGDEVADRHACRDPRVLPWVRSLPVPDQQDSTSVVIRKIGKKINMTGLTVFPSNSSKLR